jgi:hypothetical protein
MTPLSFLKKFKMLMPFNKEYRFFYEESHLNFIRPILQKVFSENNDFDLVNQNILNPYCFLLGHELKSVNQDKAVIIHCINKINALKTESTIIDDILLVETIETRGEKLELVYSTEEDERNLNVILSDLKSKLPPEWSELISIIKTITFVNILGKESQLKHFSGSDTYRWGAMHLYKNLDPLNIAECITHEGAHYWLNLYELYCPTEFISNGWDDESFISPWRKDKRPLMGIFHGIYVFSNVFNVLNFLEKQHSKEESDRLNRIGAQVKRGIEIIETHESRLSKEAIEIFYLIKNRFLEVYENSDNDLRLKYYDAILKEEFMKK